MIRATVRIMKTTTLLFAAVSVFAQQNPDATGWSLAKFGMSVDQLRQAFPAAQTVNPPQRDLGTLIRLAATPVQLGPYRASARFEFPPDQDRLTAVNLAVSDSASRPEAFESLKSSLIEKYGKPTGSDQTTERTAFGDYIVTRTVEWRVPSAMISLTWIEAGDIGHVGVRYTERKPNPTL